MNTALVAGGGGFQGLPVLRSLHAMGWRAVIADSISDSLNRYEADAFFHMPQARDLIAFRRQLLKAIEQNKARAVFPTTMYDLPALARLREELEGIGIDVFASPPDLVALLSDKLLITSACAKGGLPVLPRIDPATHDFAFPLIGKPRQGWGGVGIVKIPTAESWNSFAQKERAGDCLWQRELKDFKEWSVDFAIDRNGHCSPLVCRRRVRASGGFAVISNIFHSTPVEDLASLTASWLGMQGGYGIFNIQILEEDNGSLWLNDLNPRPGTSSISALVSGVNLVQFLLDGKSNSKAHPGLVIRTLNERFLPRPTGTISAVVFDLDETLICQKSWMRAKFEKVTKEFSCFIEPELWDLFQKEAARIIDEGPWDQLINVALARSGLSTSFSKELIDLWRVAHPEEIVIHQDCLSLIESLQAQHVPIALLSDNPAASQWQKIARLPDHIAFSTIVLTDVLSAPKPDCRGFLKVAEDLNMPPESLLMVGDSPWRDALGALRAGYAHALLVHRQGGMTNPLQNLFEKEYPHLKEKIGWTPSLYGAEDAMNLSIQLPLGKFA